MQTWTEVEIKDLLLYAKQMQDDNEDLRAGIVLMQAKLDNEEAKVRKLTMYIAHLTNVNSQM
jgi:hypothetical protein